MGHLDNAKAFALDITQEVWKEPGLFEAIQRGIANKCTQLEKTPCPPQKRFTRPIDRDDTQFVMTLRGNEFVLKCFIQHMETHHGLFDGPKEHLPDEVVTMPIGLSCGEIKLPERYSSFFQAAIKRLIKS